VIRIDKEYIWSMFIQTHLVRQIVGSLLRQNSITAKMPGAGIASREMMRDLKPDLHFCLSVRKAISNIISHTQICCMHFHLIWHTFSRPHTQVYVLCRANNFFYVIFWVQNYTNQNTTNVSTRFTNNLPSPFLQAQNFDDTKAYVHWRIFPFPINRTQN
jgi:hypothetical protein